MIKEDTINQILELSGGDSSILVELFTSFNDDSVELQNEILTAFDAKDYKALKSSIHTLKGLCGTIGATSVFEKSYEIDLELKKNGEFTNEQKINELLQENENLRAFIDNKYLK
jgi:HPt (histidine-containing phosphotransfer) domain-containing protein